MNITIRKCELQDLQALQKISVQTFVEAFGKQNTKENIESYLSTGLSLEQLEKELEHPESAFYFAEYQEEVLGYLKVCTGSAQTEAMDDTSLEIERIYLKKAMKGKGLGKKLMNKAFEIATAQNKKRIWLGVWDKNESAIAFYKKIGFTSFGKHSFLLGTDLQTDLLMEINVS